MSIVTGIRLISASSAFSSEQDEKKTVKAIQKLAFKKNDLEFPSEKSQS